MKTFTLALAAMAVGASAHSGHGHAHLHKKDLKAGSPVVNKREPAVVTKYAAAATDVVYELNGKILSPDEAKVGIKGGDFVVVGETEPTYTPPPPPPKPTTSSEPKPEPTTSSLDLGAQFIESLTPEPETTTSEPPPPPTTSAQPKPKPSPKPKPAPKPSPPSSGSGNSGGQGLDREFPDGEIPCSHFPSDYGAVASDWLDFGDWLGLQFTPKFSFGISSISDISTGIKGDTCTKGCMCSYACPPGYQKTQWPAAQGSTKESVGGLWCGNDGMLYKTRKGYNTLCEKGVGGVTVENKMNVEAVLCRTDYPGTEGMYIPAVAEAGGSVELTNPDQATYYQWDGMLTTAQYYLNPAGVGKEIACTWDSPNTPANTGNWAPTVVGVGRAKDGTTFISIFQNKPTTEERLDFNIEIVGDVNSKCTYNAKTQTYSGGNDPDGCTTGMLKGGKATIRFS